MKETRVFYKVVRRETRRSYNTDLIETKRNDILSDLGLVLTYKKGTVVKRTPYTPGIFCFETYESANTFINYDNFDNAIIQVRPIGKTRKPKLRLKVDVSPLSKALTHVMKMKRRFINRLLKELNPDATYSIPSGTVCCDAVEVLE